MACGMPLFHKGNGFSLIIAKLLAKLLSVKYYLMFNNKNSDCKIGEMHLNRGEKYSEHQSWW